VDNNTILFAVAIEAQSARTFTNAKKYQLHAYCISFIAMILWLFTLFFGAINYLAIVTQARKLAVVGHQCCLANSAPIDDSWIDDANARKPSMEQHEAHSPVL
jgi:hypothetical protein